MIPLAAAWPLLDRYASRPAREDIGLTAHDVERHRSFFDSDLHGFFCQTVPHYFHERVHRWVVVGMMGMGGGGDDDGGGRWW